MKITFFQRSKRKALLLILTFVLAISMLGVMAACSSGHKAYADDATPITWLYVNVTEAFGSITMPNENSNSAGLPTSSFSRMKGSASNGTMSYTVTFQRGVTGYVFDDNVELYVNGIKYDSDKRSLSGDKKTLSFSYTANPVSIELYEGTYGAEQSYVTPVDALITDNTIDFGTVTKSGLASTPNKDLTIKNPGQAGRDRYTGTLGLQLMASSSGSSDPESSSSSSSNPESGPDSSSSSSSSSGPVAFGFYPSNSTSISIATIQAGLTANFSISLNDTLDVGTYTWTLRIQSTGTDSFGSLPVAQIDYTVTITIEEDPAPAQHLKVIYTTYSTELASGTTIPTFGTADIEEVSSLPSKQFTFVNDGTETMTGVTIETNNQLFLVNGSVSYNAGTLAVGQSVTVTITLGTASQAGTFQINLQYLNGAKTFEGYLVLQVTVTDDIPALALEAYDGETKITGSSYNYNFGQATVGSSVPAAHSFRLVNVGRNATGNLSVTITGGKTPGYNAVSVIPSIAKNGYYDLSIQPKSGLSQGSYQNQIIIRFSNNTVAASFGVNYTLVQPTEIETIEIPAGKAVPPVKDATITNQGGSTTYYSYSVLYQEQSGENWISPSSATFAAGKTYRIRVMATISNKTYYSFKNNVTMTIGGVAAENFTATSEQAIGYRTFEPLPPDDFALELASYSSLTYENTAYYFVSVVDEYLVTTPGYFTLHNPGANATGDLTLSYEKVPSGYEGDTFESVSVIPSIAAGGNYVLEVKPALGKSANYDGNFIEDMTISNANVSITLRLVFIVNKKPYKIEVTYEQIELNKASGNTQKVEHELFGGDGANFAFDYLWEDPDNSIVDRYYENLKVGYTQAEANRFETHIRVRNRGSNNLTNITMTHSGPGDAYFDFDDDLSSTLEVTKNNVDGFDVKPKAGAPAGTHKTTMVITADNVDPVIITFSFTVKIEISQVVISGLTLPEGYDPAPRDLVVETEGVYISKMGWSKVGSAIWMGMNQNIFRDGDQYQLNLHLRTKTGYVLSTNYNTYYLPNYNFAINFAGIGDVGMSKSNWTYEANYAYCTATFTAKAPTVKGHAEIDILDFSEAYRFDTHFGVEGLDGYDKLRITWYKDGVALGDMGTWYANQTYTLYKNTITEENEYYYEITHTSRTGILRSESVFIGPNTRVKPTYPTVISKNDASSCAQTGSISWNRGGIEYRIASIYDDLEDTFTDWQDAPTEETVSGGSGSGSGAGSGAGGGGVVTGGGGGGSSEPTVTYHGEFLNVSGGAIYWFRYKATGTLVASEITVITVSKTSHTFIHTDAVVPETSELCTVNSVQEYNYCMVCGKYYDMDGNEFDSVDHVTTYATGHKDENGDLFCDYCGVSMMSRYFMRVTSVDDIIPGAKYIIVNDDGQVMEMVKSVSANGGKYVSALTAVRSASDITNDWFSSDNIDKINAFVFQIGTLPSKSTDLSTCYTFYVGNACIDFADGLVLSPKSWNDRTGFSIEVSAGNTFIISSWDGTKELAQATLKAGGNAFAVSENNKLLSSKNKVRLYRLVSQVTAVDDSEKVFEVKEKKTVANYTEMSGDYEKEGNKSSVSGVIDAISEDYVKSFAKKKGITENNAKIDIKSSVEVLSQTANEITMDVHPAISSGDKAEIIPDRNLNGREMTITLFAGSEIPEYVTHRLTTGGVEYFYKIASDPDQKTFSFETDKDGNVYITFVVTQFSTFVLSMPTPVVPETITGTVEIKGDTEVGKTLSVEIKDSNVDNGSAVYTWMRDGVAIGGATGSTYVLTNADAGAKISVSVADSTHTGSITSPETSAIAGAVAVAITGSVTISGKAEVESTLVASVKDSNYDSASAVYTWLRDGVAIGGATGPTYLLTNDDKGAKISVRVSDATHTGYLISAETEEIAEKGKEPITGTIIFEGTAQVGQYLYFAVNGGNVDDGTKVYTWYRGNTAISGATDYYYKVTSADVGYKIHVTVSDGIHEGVLISTESDEVTSSAITVGKTDCTTCSSSDGTITGVDSTMEYSVNGTDWTAITKNTITGLAPGTYYVRLKDDGSTTTTVTINAGAHAYGVWQAEVLPPDCKTTGTVAHKQCSVCKKYFNDKDEEIADITIPAGAHTFKEWTVTKAATCTASGTQMRECEVCGEVENDVIPVLGHDLVHHNGQAPTCTQKGWEEYDTCSRCDYTTYAEIDALGHDYQSVVTTPTCTEQGYTTHTCSRCLDTYVDTYVEATGHTASGWIETQAATCTEKGSKHKICTVCGIELEVEEIDALGHDIIHHDAMAATCTEKGWEEYDACTRCDYTTYAELPALGHDITHHEGQAETCMEKGWEAYDTCSRCDYSTYAEIPAGHDLVHHDGKPATCTDEGWEEYDTCSRCDYTTYAVIDALGHDYQEEVIAPTCTEQGYTTHICSRCLDTYVDTYVDATGHTVSDWIETQAATCTEKGSKHKVCSVCGIELEVEEIDALGHDIIHHDAMAATCTEKGWKEYDACSRCDYTTYVEIAALGHSYGEWEITKNPTATEAGEKRRTCSACGRQEIASIETSEAMAAFGDSLKVIDLSDGKIQSADYHAICDAVECYQGLSDEEKEWVSEDYETLVEYVREYNRIAEGVNDDVKEASKNGFSLFAALSAVLSAIWFALKNLF